jgi:alkylation response protein AidB-like acyl-CoA dehydrogenase
MMFQGLVHLAQTTKRDGRPCIEDSEIRQRLVALEGYIRSHEYSGYRQLTKGAKGENPGLIQMMNKLVATNIGSEVANLALDLLGDDGLLDPTAQDDVVHLPNANRSWVAQYMYSLGIAVAGGTANIQRNVIGERGLGLPRDYYADRSSGK